MQEMVGRIHLNRWHVADHVVYKEVAELGSNIYTRHFKNDRSQKRIWQRLMYFASFLSSAMAAIASAPQVALAENR